MSEQRVTSIKIVWQHETRKLNLSDDFQQTLAHVQKLICKELGFDKKDAHLLKIQYGDDGDKIVCTKDGNVADAFRCTKKKSLKLWVRKESTSSGESKKRKDSRKPSLKKDKKRDRKRKSAVARMGSLSSIDRAVTEPSMLAVEMDRSDEDYVSKMLDRGSGNKRKMIEVYKKWAKVILYKHGETTKRSHKISDRIMVVTTFRMILVRKGALTHNVRLNVPLVLLKQIEVETLDFEIQVRLLFSTHAEVVLVKFDEIIAAKELVQSILRQSKKMTSGWPKRISPKLNIPEAVLKDFKTPDVTPQQTITTGYDVACDMYEISPKSSIFKNLVSALSNNPEKYIDIGNVFTSHRKKGQYSELDLLQLRSVVHAVQYTDCFRKIEARGCPFGDAGITEISKLFSANKSITSIVLVDNSFGKDGARQIGQGLARGKLKLEMLDISQNQIRDSGIDAMCVALQKCQAQKGSTKVQCLNLSECGFSVGRGFKPLANMLVLPSFQKSLKRLEISDNNAARQGTAHLAEWLKDVDGLEEFVAERCNLDLAILFQGMCQNSKLFKKSLKRLNVGGQKLNHKAASLLGSMLKSTRSIEHIDLNNMKFNKDALMDILKGMGDNRHKEVSFTLDLTSCRLGESGAILIYETLTINKIDNIKTLLMSENMFGSEGLIKVCRACLKMPSIQFLDLDGNVRGSENSKVAGEQLAKLVQHGRMPNLKYLCVAGLFESEKGPCYLKENLYPLLLEVNKNDKLAHLDISKNRVGHDGIQILAKALAEDNSTLLHVLIDDNRLELASIKAIARAMRVNKKVVQILPKNDCKHLKTKLKGQDLADLQKYVKQIEHACKRNQAGYVPQDNFVTEQIMTKKYGAPRAVASMGKVMQRQHMVRLKRTKTNLKKQVKHVSVESDPELGPQNDIKEFGKRLGDITDTIQVDEYKSSIPAVLVRLEKYLVKNGGLEAPGIFSTTGNEDEYKKVKKALNKGTFTKTKDIFVIAQLIKAFFKELPKKLCVSVIIEEGWEDNIDSVISSINPVEQALFRWLLSLLSKVSRKSVVNKQTPHNLAVAFGDILFKSHDDINMIDVMEMCIVQSKSRLRSTALHKLATMRAPLVEDVETCEECGSEREEFDGEPAKFCGVCGNSWSGDEGDDADEEDDTASAGDSVPAFAGLGDLGQEEKEEKNESPPVTMEAPPTPSAAAAPPPIADIMGAKSDDENVDDVDVNEDTSEEEEEEEEEDEKVVMDVWDDRPDIVPVDKDEGDGIEQVRLRPVDQNRRPEVVMQFPPKKKKKKLIDPKLVKTIARRRKQRHAREQAYLASLGEATFESSSEEE